MGAIWTMGELLVEIMRDKPDIGFASCGTFIGPFPSGAPAIFIDTVARLGHKAGMIGSVGEDDFGYCILNRLKCDGVDCRYIHKSAGTTGTAFVSYASDGSRKYLFHLNNTAAVQAKFEPIDISDNLSYFHIMGCSLMASDNFRGEIFAAARWFQDQNAEISFDPNIREELLGGNTLHEVIDPILEQTSILFSGAHELALISDESEVERGVSKLFKNPRLKIIALKLGAKGCIIYTRKERIILAPYLVVEKDPTGAGDCFDAAFLCGLLESRSLKDSAKIASAAGALNAAAFGPMEGCISRDNVARITGLRL